MNILDETLLPLYPFYVILTILVGCLVKGPNRGGGGVDELHFGKLRDSQARRRSKWNDRKETGAGRYREEGRVRHKDGVTSESDSRGDIKRAGDSVENKDAGKVSETANKKSRRK